METYVERYVVTHVGRHGVRTLAHAQQGRNTYATAGEAQAWIDACIASSRNLGVFGLPLEVREARCYPGHFDPAQIYFADPNNHTPQQADVDATKGAK